MTRQQQTGQPLSTLKAAARTMVQVGTFKPPLFFFFSFVGSFPSIDEARPLTADHVTVRMFSN
jgi:hypothetical protein